MRGIDPEFLEVIRTASLGILVPEIAHEIGNPLFAVQGMSELLLANQETHLKTERAKTQLTSIHTSALRTSIFVRALAGLSKGGNRQQPIQAEDICEATTVVLAQAVPGLSCSKAYGKTPQILGVSVRLRQALLNLVVLYAHTVQLPASIVLETVATAASVRVTISGDRQLEPAIFEGVHIRDVVAASAERQWALVIAAAIHRVVKEHGGTLRASNSGTGSSVVLELPRAPEQGS